MDKTRAPCTAKTTGPKLEIWAYKGWCQFTWRHQLQFGPGHLISMQHELWGKGAPTKKDWKAYTYKNTVFSSIYDVSDTDINPTSIFSKKVYSNDLYTDNLIGNHLTKCVDLIKLMMQANLTQKSSIQILLNKLKLSSFKKKMQKLLIEKKLIKNTA